MFRLAMIRIIRGFQNLQDFELTAGSDTISAPAFSWPDFAAWQFDRTWQTLFAYFRPNNSITKCFARASPSSLNSIVGVLP